VVEGRKKVLILLFEKKPQNSDCWKLESVPKLVVCTKCRQKVQEQNKAKTFQIKVSKISLKGKSKLLI